jgi:hypothetical protein
MSTRKKDLPCLLLTNHLLIRQLNTWSRVVFEKLSVRSASQIIYLLRNAIVYCRVYKSLPLVSVLSQMNLHNWEYTPTV